MKEARPEPPVIQVIDGIDGEPLYFTGPVAAEGPLPAFFYFALGGQESLGLHPFNQPAVALRNAPLRVFSLTLPAHGANFDITKGVAFWRDELISGNDVVTNFVQMVSKQIDFLVERQLLDVNKLAAGGLSRGAFIALHLAVRDARIKTVLGYAPLTKLSYLRELEGLQANDRLTALDLHHFQAKLADRRIRFYMGNHDTRVGTRECYDLVEGIIAEAVAKKIRSPQVELILFPSIGHKGHGTPPAIFYDGAYWIQHCLTA